MSKLDKDYRYNAISSLRKAYDTLEGIHSNIPECCIEGYLSGRTWMNVKNSLSEKQQEKLYKWKYVPCEKCFKKNKVKELKLNGVSIYGKMINALIESIETEEFNARRAGK